MKKLILLLILLFLSGCSNQAKNTSNDYDISIVSKDNITLFKMNDNKLEKINTIKKDTGYRFLTERYINLDDNFLIKTTVIGKDALLANIDKKTFDIKLKKDGTEPYTFTYYKDKIYATNVFTDKSNIFEYDKDFKLIRKKEISYNGINITNDIQVYNDNIYLLIGNITFKQEEQVVRNLIWKMDMDFNIIEEIDLNYSNGGYLRMSIWDDNIYVTQNSRGKTATGEPAGSNILLKYNLKTSNREFIELTYSYPMYVYPDYDNNKLIINHYSLYVPNYVWTIYDINTGKQQIIYFPDRPKTEDNPPSFNQDKKYYYFLFEDVLYRYDKNSLEETKYNLSDYEITKADILITK